MANNPQAKKRIRQARKRNLRNVGQISRLRTTIKKVIQAIDSKDHNASQSAYKTATQIIDQACQKNLIHKNKAARHKKRLNAHIRALS